MGRENFSKTQNYSKLENPHSVVHKVFELMVEENVDTLALEEAF